MEDMLLSNNEADMFGSPHLMHVHCISIVAFVQHSNIILFILVHSWWYHALHWSQAIDGPNFTALAHSSQGYLMLVGPGLNSTFPLINRRVSISLALCFLLGYLLWWRYWENENLTTYLVVKFMHKVASGLLIVTVLFLSRGKYQLLHKV